MKVPLCVLILAALSELVSGLLREHIYVNTSLNWVDAQSYCRRNYYDLTTISSEEEYLKFLSTSGNGRNGWIGLYKNEKASHFSQWSDGNPITYTLLAENSTAYQYDQCVRVHSRSWSILNCLKANTFFCYTVPDLILVKEEKTWEDALEYCRANYIDLVSLTSVTDLMIANETVNATTVQIWTSLRFLAGYWYWVNGEIQDSQISLPSCPVSPNHCGARNFRSASWEARDCNEKLSFICYTWYLTNASLDNNENGNNENMQ